MTFLSSWFKSGDSKKKPSNVIHLPIKDRTLANGWTSREMRQYCREYVEAIRRDEGYER